MNKIIKEEATSVRFISKDNDEVPSGAKVISKDYSITVEEISNGYITTKSWNIEYETEKGNTNYVYPCTKTFSKENPLQESLKTLSQMLDDPDTKLAI